jgi:hypothetical protein
MGGYRFSVEPFIVLRSDVRMSASRAHYSPTSTLDAVAGTDGSKARFVGEFERPLGLSKPDASDRTHAAIIGLKRGIIEL